MLQTTPPFLLSVNLMIKKNLSTIALIVILVFAFFLRVFQVTQNPPGLTWDEAALGYNAFSILKTAHDEHGAFMPLIFKSFGDFKPGLYIYLTVPFVALFGLSTFSTRLPSVFLGTLSVYLVYLIINQIFKPTSKPRFTIGHFTALALAFQPFHLLYSRGAWETNLVSTLYLLCLYFFQRFLAGGSLFPSAIFAGLSFTAYQGAKLTLPLLVISQSLIFFPQLKQRIMAEKNKNAQLLLPILIGLSLFALVVIPAFLGGTGGRLAVKSFFSYVYPVDYETRLLKIDQRQFIVDLFHAQPLRRWRSIASRYFHHLSPQLLFIEGDWQTHFAQIPGVGLLYLCDAVFIALGIYFFSQQKNKQLNLFWFSLLVIAPLAAAPTLDEVSSIRAHFLTIPLSLLSGAGLYFLSSARGFWRRLLSLIISLTFILEIIFVMDSLYIHFPHQNYSAWLYGYQDAVKAVAKHPADQVVFSNRLGQPYIFYLFYTHYDPTVYQSQPHLIINGPDVGYVPELDQIKFHSFSFQTDTLTPNTLYVATTADLNTSQIDPQKGQVVEEIKAPDGNVVFRLIKTPPL